MSGTDTQPSYDAPESDTGAPARNDPLQQLRRELLAWRSGCDRHLCTAGRLQLIEHRPSVGHQMSADKSGSDDNDRISSSRQTAAGLYCIGIVRATTQANQILDF
ncbi:hypothetical protein ABBQ32_011819 [Trebouxia sp. C0010 RCD-2024]